MSHVDNMLINIIISEAFKRHILFKVNNIDVFEYMLMLVQVWSFG